MSLNGYKICNTCVMDTSDPEIDFDEKGICNHCRGYKVTAPKRMKHGPAGQQELADLVQKIKEDGKGKPYDCIIGLSGGVDSSYVAYKVIKLGLRPLAIHFDSGWNSELAVKNIQNIVQKLGIDLYTYVCDWREMKDLQLSYFKAGVINADIPMDHAFIVVLHRIAREKNIKYFFSGHNYETEAVLPAAWVYKATDGTNLKAIQRRFGSVKLKKYPVAHLLENLFTKFIFKLKTINLLDYERYNKSEAMHLIENELGWKYYGGKHYESIFTRFYQGHYLINRFGVDKRRAHLSTLICSGQIDRQQALDELALPAYPDQQLLAQDLEFVPKKLGISPKEFQSIMSEPTHSHTDYENDEWVRAIIRKLGKIALGREIEI